MQVLLIVNNHGVPTIATLKWLGLILGSLILVLNLFYLNDFSIGRPLSFSISKIDPSPTTVHVAITTSALSSVSLQIFCSRERSSVIEF